MLKSFLVIFIFFLAAMLCSCVPKKDFTYEAPTAAHDKRCVARCLKGKTYCEQLCLWKNQGCWTRQQQRAQAAYDAYKQAQLSAGKKPRKRLRDFEDTRVCLAACHCVPAYNTCYTACGGTVGHRA